MSELIEFLLEFMLEVLLNSLDLWAGWRFLLPLVTSLGMVGLICWTVSNSTVRLALSVPVVLVGALAGLVWQIRNG
jgi:hypothetical protein